MKELFKNLGADEKEMKVFLKLLELGAQPVSVIARNVHTPRSSMYLILERLKDLGLVEKFERAGIIYFKSVSPKEMGNILNARKNKVERTLDILKTLKPEMEKLENKLGITPTVRFFEGKTAVMKMYEEILAEKEFCACFNPHLVKNLMPEYHYKIPETLKRKKGKAKELLVDCEEAREYKKLYNSKTHQIKTFPGSAYFESDTVICKNKIYMISYGEKEVSAIEIVNKALANTQKVLFEIMWDSIK
jgi:sugar-specific transcriptional regulator TrmB